MARPKSPQKLLEEALAKGDLEAIKAAYAKTKEKPKEKVVKTVKSKKVKILEKEYDTDNDGAVLLVKQRKGNDFSEFRTNKNEEDSNDVRQSIPQKFKTGQQVNKFKPDKFGTPLSDSLIKEDKKALKKWSPKSKDYRDGADITEVKVGCASCKKIFSMEQWELDAKNSVSELELLCNRCLRERK